MENKYNCYCDLEETPKHRKNCINRHVLDKSEYVYHVAHPEVRAVILEKVFDRELCGTKVRFERRVNFSGNPNAIARFEWLCSENLLCESQEEAKARHIPQDEWDAGRRPD